MGIIRKIAKMLYEHTDTVSHKIVLWDDVPVKVKEYWYDKALKASHLYMEWAHAYPRVLEPLPLGEDQGWSIKTSDICQLVNEWKNIQGRDPLICGESSAPEIYQLRIKEIHKIFLFGPPTPHRDMKKQNIVKKLRSHIK